MTRWPSARAWLALGLSAGVGLGCGSSAEPADPPSPSSQEPAAPPSPAPPSAAASAQRGVRFGGAADGTLVDLAERSPAQVRVRVFEPYEERAMQFDALPALPLLDEQLGPAWRQADELVFECADGYRAAVPVSRFLAHQAFFAVSRVDADFAIDKPVGGATVRTALAPAYLVWENMDDALVRSEGDWGWPYQVVGVTIAEHAAERYARMAPPADASESATRGFAIFRRYCSRCHAINGEGGAVGPELNYPASVSEYIEPSWLRRWVDAPQTVRRGTPMPGLPEGIPERDAALDDVLAYLNAMAQRKLGPDPVSGAH